MRPSFFPSLSQQQGSEQLTNLFKD